MHVCTPYKMCIMIKPTLLIEELASQMLLISRKQCSVVLLELRSATIAKCYCTQAQEHNNYITVCMLVM